MRINLNIDISQDKSQVVEQAKTDKNLLAALVENLSEGSRRRRQYAASVLAEVAHTNASALEPYIDELVDALARPEAQTRWEVLSVLADLSPIAANKLSAAIPEMEDSLYDEESNRVRLAAFKFLCAYGSGDAERSKEVWPHLEDVLRCYHGDDIYIAMLEEFLGFASSGIDADVALGIVDLLEFDATSQLGGMNAAASQIIAAAKANK